MSQLENNGDPGYPPVANSGMIPPSRDQFVFKVTGSGEPVLFLHGWGGDKSSWEPLVAELGQASPGRGESFQCVTLDLPGFGLSDAPAEPWTLDDYTDFAEKFVEFASRSLGWSGQYNLVVHSFGGRIAIKLAQRSNRIKKAVFIAAAGIKHPLSLKSKIGYAVGKVGKKVLALPGIRRFQKPARKLLYKALGVHDFEKTEGSMRQTFLNVIAEDLVDQIDLIKFPVCLIWGTEDSYVPLSDAFVMHQKINNSELHVIEGGRHGIHKTHPKELAEWIRTFLNN